MLIYLEANRIVHNHRLRDPGASATVKHNHDGAADIVVLGPLPKVRKGSSVTLGGGGLPRAAPDAGTAESGAIGTRSTTLRRA